MARDLHVTINADTSRLENALRVATGREAIHFYGVDEYHNARLIGAYHAHKGAGAEWLLSWLLTLGLRDKAYIRIYEAKGEWGRTDLVSTYDLGAKLAQGITMGIMPGMSFYLADMQQRHMEAQLREEQGETVIAEWVYDPGTFDDTLIILERIKLRTVLEKCYLPLVAACWVASRLPSWLLPAVLYCRLQMQMAHEGDIIRKWFA